MSNMLNWKKILPHVLAIAVFLIVAVIYCKPTIDGKVLNQHDTQGWKGMAQQSFEVKEKTGKFPLWTNSMFGGMPTFQIAMDGETNIGIGLTYINKVFSFGLPIPISFFFLAALCFYILCLVGGANPWVAMLGGLAYAYSTYNPIIVSVGHNTKMLALAYAPMVIAGMLLLFQKKYILGFAITAFFASTMIAQNHLQIVYYLLIIAGCMSVAFIVKSVKENELAHALKSCGLALIAGLIGLATTAALTMPTYEYAKESMRGGVSQLTINKDTVNNKTKGGLDKDYALRWSIGPMETFTFMVPGLLGGSNGGNEHTGSSKFAEKIAELGVPEESGMSMTNGYSYWGNMSSMSETTSGPVYMSAIICCLFIFGLVYLKGWTKWWVVAASVFGILLAWGNSFPAFNYFMLDHMPFLSKFRAPSMALVIPQFCIPFLAVMTLSQLVNEKDNTAAFKKFKLAAMITGGVLLFLAAFYFMADYAGKGDAQIKDGFVQQLTPQGQQPNPQAVQQATTTANGLMSALRDDRRSLAGKDLMISIFFIGATLGLIFLYLKQKVNALIMTIVLIVLTCLDLFLVDTRYMNYEDFKEAEEVSNAFTPTQADLQIMKDPDHANFRVFNQSGNFTNEAMTSYHHNSIGGYHPAKLGLYQDLIENQISKGNIQVLNMLNTKYVIAYDQTGAPMAQQNPGAFGNCWLVKGVQFVNGPNAEMLALDSVNLRDTAVVDEAFKTSIKQLPVVDTTAFIKVKVRNNDNIIYDFSAATPQFAVFSEVYYKGGWNAYVDGQKTDYVKTNYVLRGIALPAGKHTVEFKFEPQSYKTGNTISFWATLVIYAAIILAIVFFFKQKKEESKA
jgi:hypothetical protein